MESVFSYTCGKRNHRDSDAYAIASEKRRIGYADSREALTYANGIGRALPRQILISYL